eukprot:1180924-Prorocentrum_minimum.AAC.3
MQRPEEVLVEICQSAGGCLDVRKRYGSVACRPPYTRVIRIDWCNINVTRIIENSADRTCGCAGVRVCGCAGVRVREIKLGKDHAATQMTRQLVAKLNLELNKGVGGFQLL